MTAVRVREPARAATSRRSPAAVRLVWLHLRSRRAPSAVAALAVIAFFFWAVVANHWTLGASGRTTMELPMLFEGCTAAVIAITTHSPFGEPERATGRWLPFLRLGVVLALCGLAIGLLALAAAIANGPGAYLDGGTLPLVRNVLGMTGIGLLLVPVTGGLLGWAGPLAFIAISEFTLIAQYTTPLTWPARPPEDRGGWIAAMAVFAVGLVAYTFRGARNRLTDSV
jgi:hypothetical protein